MCGEIGNGNGDGLEMGWRWDGDGLEMWLDIGVDGLKI